MFALKSRQSAKARAAWPVSLGASRFADRFVLPRWLRKPVRSLGRFAGGDVKPPRFAASMATVALFSLSGLYGAYVGGDLPAYARAVTARTGFAIDEVRVSGNRETSEIDILQELDLDGWTSLVGFDAEDARQRITQLPWIKVASVRKIYPDAIEVKVEEREPFAIWQRGTDLTVIEQSGAPITAFRGGRLAALPLVIGGGAPQAAADFVDKIKRYPELAAQVKAYIRIAERRWDVRLANGITVKLPETGDDLAIAELVKMDRENALLSRDITTVDLRLDDRLVVRLTPDAATRREAALKDQAKAAKKKPGKSI